jgi:hypothetical protein
LLDKRDIAEFAAGGLLRALCGLAALDAIVCRHLQMALDLFTEIGLLPRFSPRWEFHVPLLFVT